MSSTQATTIRSASTLTADAAERLVGAAARKAQAMGKPMAIAVCDPAGHLIAYRRMDGAPLLATGISQDKAYTAVSFGISTDAVHEFIKDDAPLALGMVHQPRLIVFGGGFPVNVDGELVGGIGVSGGLYTEDMQVAQAALVEEGFAT